MLKDYVIPAEEDSPMPDEFQTVAQVVGALGFVLSVQVFGLITIVSGMSWSRLHDLLVVRPLVTLGTVMLATLTAAMIFIAARGRRAEKIGLSLLRPFTMMIALILGVPASVALVALIFYGEYQLFLWAASFGIGYGIAAFLVGLVLVAITAYAAFIFLAVVVVWLLACVMTWFGSGSVHPMLPGICKLVYVGMQAALITWALVKGEGAEIADVVYVISLIGPACLAIIGVSELRYLHRDGIRLHQADQ